MKQALPILEKLVALLPEIQRALGERWPEVVRQLRELAKSFEDSSDEASLEQAAQQLYALLRKDESVLKVLTMPRPNQATRLPRTLSTEDIASRFYLLCQQADRLVQQLRLDVAAPDQVRQGQSFELAAAVRLPSSPVLNEDDLARAKSGQVQAVWPKSKPYVQLRVEVIAPACQIHSSDSAQFRLFAGQDSLVFYFTLTPQQIGEIGLVVQVYQEDDWLGSARLRIACGQVVGNLQVTQNLSASLEERAQWVRYRTHLRRTLEAHFDESELRTLCSDMDVDYENLPYSGKADKVRELILYFERQNRIPELVAVLQEQRPAVSWGEIPLSMRAVA